METWFKATVIVDVASVAYSIGDARGLRSTRREPSSALVANVLRHHGIEPVEFVVAVPGYEVSRWGRRPNVRARRAFVGGSTTWVEQQVATCDVPVTVVKGATDGRTEIGVDDIAVAAAIDRGLDIAAGLRDSDGLLILSEDEDLEVVADYVPNVPTYVARRRFTAGQRREFNRRGHCYITLGDAGCDNMAPGAIRILPSRTNLSDDGLRLMADGNPISGSLAVNAGELAGERDPVLRAAPTVAVVDAYGITNSAVPAIGAAQLPSPDSVEGTLLELGFDRPFSHYFVVPDVPDRVVRYQLHGVHRDAWDEDDRTYEALRVGLRHDDDPLTTAIASRLVPERRGQAVPLRREVVEKRSASLILADIVYALRQAPNARVVVFSDRPEVDVALHEIQSKGIGDTSRVTRVGIHACPVALEGSGDSAASRFAAAHHRVTLTAGQLAALVRVSGKAFGADYRGRLSEVIDDRSVRWQIVRYDASANGVVVRAEHDERFEVVLSDYLEVGAGALGAAHEDGIVNEDGRRFSLVFDPERPCALPAVRTEGSPAKVENRRARILGRDGDELHLDIDDDGVIDVELPAGHDRDAYATGDTVALRRDGRHHPWVLLGGSGTGEARPVTVVELLLGADGSATARDLDTEASGPITVPAGLEGSGPSVGERRLAVLVDGEGYLALSTALPHLV